MARQKLEIRNKIESQPRVWTCVDGYTRNTYITFNGRAFRPGASENFLLRFNQNKLLGQGSSGSVYSTEFYEQSSLSYRAGDKVVKVFENLNDLGRRDLQNEYDLGKNVPHLGMSALVEDGNKAYLVMNHLPGEDLIDLINIKPRNQSMTAIKGLSTDKKLELTYKLFLALRDQVSKLNLVHRDIKPENIRVQLEPNIRVYIVDYGYVKKDGVDDGERKGTPAYAAPEMFYDYLKHGKPSDVYSMARVCTLLWIWEFSTYEPPANISLYNPHFDNRIEILTTYSTDQLNNHNKLRSLIADMLTVDQEYRPNIDTVINRFENLYPEITANVAREKECDEGLEVHAIGSPQFEKLENNSPLEGKGENDNSFEESAADCNDSETDEEINESNLQSQENTPSTNMFILNGFITILGIAALAVAFVVLNAASFGAVGVIVASLGSTAMLVGGIGLFASSKCLSNDTESSNGLTT